MKLHLCFFKGKYLFQLAQQPLEAIAEDNEEIAEDEEEIAEGGNAEVNI